MALRLPIKAQHFLRNKPRGPQSWVVWVTYWITALKSILPQHSAFAIHLSVPCNSSMFLSLTTEYSSMVHTAVYPRAMNLPNCKIWRKHLHKMPSVQAPTTSLVIPSLQLSWLHIWRVSTSTLRFNNLLEQFTELRESAIFRITISL